MTKNSTPSAKKRIIINFEGVTEQTAIHKVSRVIDDGRVSKNDTHYCWLTVFSDGVVVSTCKKRKGQKTDSFIVYRE